VEEAGRAAQAAALRLATLNTQTKNDALLMMAEALLNEAETIWPQRARSGAPPRRAGCRNRCWTVSALTPPGSRHRGRIRAVAALRDRLAAVFSV